jgi:hypothetical protein
VFYGVVQDHLATLLDTARDRSEHGFGYPRFVEREFEKFLACGLLCRGFVRVRCDHCADERLVAFSCKTRGFCPSCTSRRMAGTAAQLVDRVLPAIPYRQWVLSLPRQIRFLIARERPPPKVLGVFSQGVRLATSPRPRQWHRRSAVGAVIVQRFGLMLNLTSPRPRPAPRRCLRGRP